MREGRAESNNTLINTLSGYANQGVKPRKPLTIFIEGLFQVAMKIVKGFQKYGVSCQAPFNSLLVV